MILKNIFIVAALALMASTSAISMHMALRNLGSRHYGLGLRRHSDFPAPFKEPFQKYRVLYRKAENVKETCVQGMKTTKNDKLVIYAEKFVTYAELIKYYFDPYPFTDLSVRVSNIRKLRLDMRVTRAEFQYLLSHLKKHPNLYDLDHPQFKHALNSLDDLTATLDESPPYTYSSIQGIDLTMIALIFEKAEDINHMWLNTNYLPEYVMETEEIRIANAGYEYAECARFIKSCFNQNHNALNKLPEGDFDIKQLLDRMKEIEVEIQSQLNYLHTKKLSHITNPIEKRLEASRNFRETIAKNSHLYTSSHTKTQDPTVGE